MTIMRWVERWVSNNIPKRKAIGYVRHSAEGHQKQSIPIQKEKIRAYANRHNIEIIFFFEDAGVSGLTADRPQFQAMMRRIHVDPSFDLILVLDHTRWGRFQDPDLAKMLIAECRKCGKQVHFTEHDRPVPPFGEIDIADEFNDVMGHRMAARFSAQLSDKVWAGEAYAAKRGFRCGGKAPYGMVRVEYDEQEREIGVMRGKARKRFPNGHVGMKADNSKATRIVKEIFKMFAVEKILEQEIADRLNRRKIPSPKTTSDPSSNIPWGVSAVRKILQDEQYAGSIVYNKTSNKLKTGIKRNSKEAWIVAPGRYKPVVSREIFESARAIFEERAYIPTCEELLEQARTFYKKYGMLPPSLFRYFSDAPLPRFLVKRFGSVHELYQSLFIETLRKVRDDLVKRIETEFQLDLFEDFFIVNESITISIVPAVPVPRGYGYEWFFRRDTREVVDVTLGVALSDIVRPGILGYFPLSRWLVREDSFCIGDQSRTKIALYGFADLDFLHQMVHRHRTEQQ